MKNPKILHILAKSKQKDFNKKSLSKLPKHLFIVYSIQYQDLAINIRNYLKSKKYNLMGFQQVLGCTKLQTKYPILLVGSGKFHAQNLAMQNSTAIYIYTSGKINKFSEKDKQKLKAKQKAALSKFYMAEKIGILVSTKPGQNNMNKALALKKQLETKNKQVYIFLSNNINISEFENFQMDIWVNTACPGLAYDSGKIINSDDILQK